MSFFDQILGNLRGSGIVYLVCIAAIVGAFKYLANHPQPRKFILLGAGLILAAGLGGGMLQAILYQVMVGTQLTDFKFDDTANVKRRIDAVNTWGLVSGILSFLTGVAYAAGIASLVYATFADKMGASRRTKQKPTRRPSDDEYEDEDDRPRRRRKVRDDDDEDNEDEDDDRPRRRSRRD